MLDWDDFYASSTVHFRTIPTHVLSDLLEEFGSAASVLDAGCGRGHLLQQLEEIGFRNLAGVDSSKEAVKAASALNPKSKVFQMDIERDRMGSYDFVICHLVLSFLERPFRFCKNIGKLTQTIIISVDLVTDVQATKIPKVGRFIAEDRLIKIFAKLEGQSHKLFSEEIGDKRQFSIYRFDYSTN